MTESQLTLLIKKYISGEANEEEKAQIEQWYESFDASGIEFAKGDAEKIDKSTARSLRAIREKIEQARLENMQEKYRLKSHKKVSRWWRAAAAVVLLLVFSEMAHLFFHKTGKPETPAAVQPIRKDFKPGGNKAVLTLGNGQRIVLDSSGNGLLSVQGSTKVIKLNNGQLAYNTEQKAKSKKQKVLYNTITTPRGGKYEIVLPDGSKIWLNAASSIRFPTAFVGENREVEMTGEAYFEIAKDAGKPFIVKLPPSPSGEGRGEVQVLGTHFNVMAYDNEASMKVTLLEGAVKIAPLSITGEGLGVKLKPGEQAQVNKSGKIQLIENANINEAIAWKNNLFWFENDNIQSVMRQLSRWYDVDVNIQDNIPDLFTGSIPRDLTFSKVFEVLQKTGSMHYKIEDKKIIVTL